ncbi:hypothetical protein OS242_10530 [Tumebacillus sp. DT12]|uniref:Heme exporter protein D n=1 Tax=Tumebacillus lacus TaxID=2995335 RepID=A0ABT3X353_9BACL|nr:hypothetical protein [Tumebacillus lacus]MCX7570398.1 hypothetical protein [Tumebacillus lacus]
MTWWVVAAYGTGVLTGIGVGMAIMTGVQAKRLKKRAQEHIQEMKW